MGGRRIGRRRGVVPNSGVPRTRQEDRSVAALVASAEAVAAVPAAASAAAEAIQTQARAEEEFIWCRACHCRYRADRPCPLCPSRFTAVPVLAKLSAPSRGVAALDPCQDLMAEPPSGRTQAEMPVSYLSKLLGTTTLKEPATSSSSPQAAEIPPTPPSKPTVLVNKPPGWYFSIFIRTDLSGSFHTYPHLGGPFKSMQEVETAIECYLQAKRHKTLWDKEAELDMVVRKALYWPDGTTRKCSDEYVMEHTRQQKSLMLQALLDKYNEDHNLFGDLAYELNNILHYGTICEDLIWYKHFNFIAKTKGGVEDLFFAEVTSKDKGPELVANSFCKIKSNENGHCYGCKNNGYIDMKHPDKADEYIGGHLDTYLPFSRSRRPNTWTGSKEDIAAEEARLKYIFGLC